MTQAPDEFRITTRHPASHYGMPVILDGEGCVLDPLEGFKRVLTSLGWTATRAAEKFGCSEDSVNSMRIGRREISAQVLNVLADELLLVQE